MNQTQKRLSMINTAIAINDIEAIQLQISKLRLLGNDEKIRTIINALESKNYAYSQTLIAQYIDMPIQTVHQRSYDQKQETHTEKEKELIKKFDLHVLSNNMRENNELIDMETAPKKKSAYDSFLNLSADDILTSNISIKKSEDDFFSDKKTKEPVTLITEEIPRDNFFDTVPTEEEPFQIIEEEKEIKASPSVSEFTIEPVEEREVEPIEIETKVIHPIEQLEEKIPKVFADEIAIEVDETYPPILSIKEQFEAFSQKYPPTQTSSQAFPSVTHWLEKIKTEGYAASEIEDAVREALKLSANESDEEYSEAAELILLLGCCENKFAKLILARELFKGNLFTQNIPDAFSLIFQLANDKYPEALCDLGQFYEYGIGTQSSTKEARKLYKEAMELGIHRAEAHFKRVKKGFFF